ncbi:hypothetical protein SeMB42_g06045 [Synchytrium endobioticum]|uniref:Uncharacterized protein n=1 Tax=Synchytrium endobioticum TaxID=286115 RepID=A0A507CMM5_9FUNG|nr:hypothetical protein SeMB42_g06045 [Synchytrium endobioticum]TPX44195.1 hypothetical protein SeLEV6574_g04647 [Synchytrium endobioticum]
MAWENVKKRARRLSDSFSLSAPSPRLRQFEPETAAAPVKLKLGETTLIYEDHNWKRADGSSDKTVKMVENLTDRNRALEAENQLLKFKVNVLLDMLAGTKLDLLEIQKELSD